MSRPRFLADQNVNEHILTGILRREPLVEIVRVRDVGMAAHEDAAVLDYAAAENLIVLSHDVNTMPAAAYQRTEAGRHMAGLFMVRQTEPVAAVIDSIVMIWSASEAEEWRGRVEFLPI